MSEKKVRTDNKKKDPRMKGKYVYYPYNGEKSSEKIEASQDDNKR